MTSQAGKQAVGIHVLPNVSRSKGNQTMKLGQLVKCNMGNILLEKLQSTFGGETVHRPFSKKINIKYISRSIT